jgi:membrane protease YdiL (CAAX protease family)
MKNPRYPIVFALISFLIGMALLLFVGAKLQAQLGMMGLALTELMILAVAIVSVLASRMDFKQVFRVKRSSKREWLGSLLIYLGAFFGTSSVSYLLNALVPGVGETGEYISGFIMSGGFVFALIAVSILPGICEEAWHRGYLLSSLGSIRSVAARVAIMGLVFGVFHFDPTRFLQTMILGFALSFMRIKTDNLLVPMAFHSLNNLTSVGVLFGFSFLTERLPGQGAQMATENSAGLMEPGILIPLVLLTLSLSVLFLTLGRLVFKRIDRASALAAGVVTGAAADAETSMTAASQPTPLPTGLYPSPSVRAMIQPEQQPPWQPPQQPPLSAPPQRDRKTVVIVIICLTTAALSCLSCFLAPLLLSL